MTNTQEVLHMKGKTIIPVLLSALLLTACSSTSSSDQAYYAKGADAGYASESFDSYSYESENGIYDTAEVSGSSSSSGSPESEKGLSSDRIKKEMLVYTCNMSIDVLNFDEAIAQYRNYLDGCGGFIETESYNDGGSTGRWYYENEEKWKSYSATIRIPSTEYDNFCNAASGLGDLRSKNASVENVSNEYHDLSTSLEIYEAKEKRYLALLADITDEEYAVTIERELTDIQIQIAQIKTRMNRIETDVAYSYVNISINEVKQYREEPVKNDTFIQRLGNTVSDTVSDFLDFLEELLFVIIHLLPYLILIGIIVVIVLAARKKIRAKKALKAQAAITSNEPAEAEQSEKEQK